MLNQAPWRECGSCHRLFHGDACYENHCRPNKQGESVCEKFYKCLQCHKVLSRHRRKTEDHQCGEVMCPTSEEFVDPNRHLCYIQPIESESEKEERERGKRKRKQGQKRQRRAQDLIDNSAEEEDDEQKEGDDDEQ